MKRTILITIAFLSFCLIFLIWLEKSSEEKLAERISKSKNFIAYNKLNNEYLQILIFKLHHRRDSIRKERTKNVFDYSFQKKDTLPIIKSNNSEELLKRNIHESSAYFRKVCQEFPELSKMSGKSIVTIFKRARQILNEK